MPFALVSKTLDELVGRKLSPIARIEMLADRRRISQESPRSAASLREVIRACASWLCTAQDNSISSDGGVARHYSLLDGWGPSYPVNGDYNSFEFLNWAAKFFTDSARYELELRLRYGITLSDTV